MVSQEDIDRKNTQISERSWLNFSSLFGNLIKDGYTPEAARRTALLILALVGITMLARSL